MQSSYSVIKKTSVLSQGHKKIVTDCSDTNVEIIKETNAKEFIDSYENLAKTMLENSRRKSDEIISKAFDEAQKIQKDAYPKAYEKGYKDGSQKGYDEAYNSGYVENVKKAKEEVDIMIKNAQNTCDKMIESTKEECAKYIEEKKQDIKFLIENTIENILQREIKEPDCLNEVVFNELSNIKNCKSIIIKAKEMYTNEFSKKIDDWKNELALKGDVFIIPDDSIGEGNVLIQKDNGKVIVDCNLAMNKVKDILNTSE